MKRELYANIANGEKDSMAAENDAVPMHAAVEGTASGRRLIGYDVIFPQTGSPVRDNMAVA